MLYFVIRYRVHIQISYSTPARRPRSARKPSRPGPRALEAVAAPEIVADLASALVNLGAKPAQARKAAARAAGETDDFTAALLLAIQYTQKEKAA
jgi:hypothetical protein